MKLPSSCPQWWIQSFSLQPTISVTGQTGRLVSLCNQKFLGESSVTKELGQHRSVPLVNPLPMVDLQSSNLLFQVQLVTSPVYLSSCEATVTESCVSRHSVGRLCNRLVKGIILKKLPVQLTCHHQFSVTGKPL